MTKKLNILYLFLTVFLVIFQESRCAYVICVMAIMWLTEAIPISATSLMPIFLAPMLGIATAKDMSGTYTTVSCGSHPLDSSLTDLVNTSHDRSHFQISSFNHHANFHVGL